MYKIRTLNNISAKGLARFPDEGYRLGDMEDPDAILVRSHKLTPEDAGPSLVAVGRAGAGVNNIPVADYTDKGIVVFNASGANANAVKELVVACLLLSCRGIIPGIRYVDGLGALTDKAELDRVIEANKRQYRGRELKGRTLGVLGLGAIGSMVADVALRMGMNVLGYDPALSVEAAWRVSSEVVKVDKLQTLFSKADMVTLHVPMLGSTRGMIDGQALTHFRDGAVLINFARGEVVDSTAVAAALGSGRLSRYISDFPVPGLIGQPGVIFTPHLGASTREAEENCALMVADRVRDFLENGNIGNSVNFPSLSLERTRGAHRIAFANDNVPRVLGSVLSTLADRNINVVDMLNKSRDNVAYNLVDIETPPTEELVEALGALEGVIKVRLVDPSSA